MGGMSRSHEVSAEVPGTPEHVWEAIATGPGISAWFVPTDLEPRAGGAIVMRLGLAEDARGVVTAYDAPRRFAYEERWNDSTVATEFLVEAKDGSCVVRIVTSGFAAGDDWDAEIERMDEGWRSFLAILALYLEHFPGRHPVPLSASIQVPGELETRWSELVAALELTGEARVAAGAIPLAGVVERRREYELVLRTDVPAPGLADVTAFAYDGAVMLRLQASLFGPEAAAAAATAERAWNDLLLGVSP